jgi:hypothetical protein
MNSLGIDPNTLGTAQDAKVDDGVGPVYMPGGGESLVKQYNLLAKQSEDLQYKMARLPYGASASAYRTQLTAIQNKMKSVQAKMARGEGGGFEVLDYETARLLPTGWSPQRLKEFVNKGIMYGIPGFDVGMGMPEIISAWDDLVKASATFSTSGKKWSPWDVMDSYGGKDQKFGTMTKGDWVYDVATGERLKYVGKTTRTTKSEQVDLSSPEEAQALITQVLREALGRAPNAEELAKFKATVAGYEKSTPEVTTVTETATPESIAAAQASGGDVFTGANQSSVTSGGVSDAARAALVQAPTEKTKEYAKYQSGTTYYDAMMQMIGGG